MSVGVPCLHVKKPKCGDSIPTAHVPYLFFFYKNKLYTFKRKLNGGF